MLNVFEVVDKQGWFSKKQPKKNVAYSWNKPAGKNLFHVNNLQKNRLFDHSDY